MTKYQHVIWDWNGTLFDDGWLCLDVMNEALIQRALPTLSPERYMKIFDFPVIDYYRRAGFDFEKESFAKVGGEFMAVYNSRRHEAQLRDQATSVLARFNESGVTQSVLSAYHHDWLEEALRHFGIRDAFKQVMGLGDHHAHSKIELGQALMKTLPYDADNIVLVGDTVHDFEVAQTLGVDCLLIPGGNHSRQKLETCGVPVFDTLDLVLRRVV